MRTKKIVLDCFVIFGFLKVFFVIWGCTMLQFYYHPSFHEKKGTHITYHHHHFCASPEDADHVQGLTTELAKISAPLFLSLILVEVMIQELANGQSKPEAGTLSLYKHEHVHLADHHHHRLP